MTQDLLFLFLVVHPAATPKRIYSFWYKHPTLKEYKRPELKEIVIITENLKIEIRKMGFYC